MSGSLPCEGEFATHSNTWRIGARATYNRAFGEYGHVMRVIVLSAKERQLSAYEQTHRRWPTCNN